LELSHNEDFELRNTRIIRAIDILLKYKNNDEVIKKIENLFLGGHYPVKISAEFHDILKKYNLDELIDKKYKDFYEKRYLEDFQQSKKYIDKADEVFIFSIVNALDQYKNVEDAFIVDEKRMISLSFLYETMNVWKLPITEYYKIGFKIRNDLLELAIIASAIAADINMHRLYHEAKYVAENILCKDNNRIYRLILKVNPDVNWTRVNKLNLSSTQLIELLNHPYQVVSTVGAYIIDSIKLPSDFSEMTKNVLKKANSNMLYFISQLADKIWSSDAIGILINHLENHSLEGNSYLFKCIPQLADNHFNDAWSRLYMKALNCNNVDLAIAASESLLNFKNNQISEKQLFAVYEFWLKTEAPYPKGGGVIPRSPRSLILKLIAAKKNFTFEELTPYLSDDRSDVVDIAIVILLDKLIVNNELLAEVLQNINNYKIPLLSGCLNRK